MQQRTELQLNTLIVAPAQVKRISIIVPAFNEEQNIAPFCVALNLILDQLTSYDFEIIFVDDGSTDGTFSEIEQQATIDSRIRYIQFSRNFGKEVAITAGLNVCHGDAGIIMDADLQHPAGLIPEFISRWQAGAEVVIGVRKSSKSDRLIKRWGSVVFYKMINLVSEVPIIPQATDFRLLDRVVIDAFNRMTERGRMTRGLIDWLGFRRVLIYFDAQERANGLASYSMMQLVKLAIVSFISLSLVPLRMAGYLGAFITLAAGILGSVMFLDRYIVNWGLNFSGPAILADIILFMVGIVLISMGLLAFYIGNIYREVQNRPMYVVRKIYRVNGKRIK